jgi:hypothetical protein
MKGTVCVRACVCVCVGGGCNGAVTTKVSQCSVVFLEEVSLPVVDTAQGSY